MRPPASEASDRSALRVVWKLDFYYRSAHLGLTNTQPPPITPHNIRRHGQADPLPGLQGIQPLAAPDYLFALVLGNTGAIVFHGQM